MNKADDLHLIAQEADETARLERLTHHMARLRDGVTEMKDAMKEMAAAINRLAVIEERQNQDRNALERAFNAIENCKEKQEATTAQIESRLRALELLTPTTKRATDAVHNVTWLLVAAFVGALITKVFKVAA
jgi:chromosome segregation ATPase